MKVGVKIALGALAIALSGQRALAEANNAAALTEELTRYYRPVGIGAASGAHSQLKLLTVRQPGILGIASAAAASSLEACPSIFRSGRLYRPPGVFCSKLANQPQKRLEVGERVYVTSIIVNSALDKVSFYLAACGACKPDAQQAVLRSLVVFEFHKGSLAKADSGEIVQTINRVLIAEAPAADPPAPAPLPPAAQVPSTSSESVVEKPAAEAVAPPPAVAAIVKEGQTPEVVERVLGSPQVIFELGTKLVHIYPNFKVFYIGGKLADVQ
jgi:hypothetical protein